MLHSTLQVLIIGVFAAIALAFAIVFGSESTIIVLFLKNNHVFIAFSIFFVLLLFTLIYPTVLLKDYFYRPFQIRKIAKKYNLNYTKGEHFIEANPELLGKRNIIEGNINGYNVLIYDFIDKEGYPIGISAFTRRSTIISINGVQEERKGLISGFCPPKEVDLLLSNCLNKKVQPIP